MMTIFSSPRMLFPLATCLCFSPALASAQGCGNGGSAGAATAMNGTTPAAQAGLSNQFVAFQGLMQMQQNMQQQQQLQQARMILQQQEMQRQMLMARMRQQQMMAARKAAAEQARAEQEAETRSPEEEAELKNMSRLERKKYAIRERRRLRELARAEKD